MLIVGTSVMSAVASVDVTLIVAAVTAVGIGGATVVSTGTATTTVVVAATTATATATVTATAVTVTVDSLNHLHSSIIRNINQTIMYNNSTITYYPTNIHTSIFNNCNNLMAQ